MCWWFGFAQWGFCDFMWKKENLKDFNVCVGATKQTCIIIILFKYYIDVKKLWKFQNFHYMYVYIYSDSRLFLIIKKSDN